jgi:hypothetical protein
VPAIEFSIEALMRDDRGLVVCGRCCEAEFGVGDAFTELRWVRFERDPQTKCLGTVASDIDAEVSLRVDEIGFYGRTVERLERGYTAGIRFSGEGLDRIERLDLAADLRAGKVWSLAIA